MHVAVPFRLSSSFSVFHFHARNTSDFTGVETYTEPTHESGAESFSEEDIAQVAELLRELEESYLADEVKTSLDRFAESGSKISQRWAAAVLEEAAERSANHEREMQDLRAQRDATLSADYMSTCRSALACALSLELLLPILPFRSN